MLLCHISTSLILLTLADQMEALNAIVSRSETPNMYLLQYVSRYSWYLKEGSQRSFGQQIVRQLLKKGKYLMNF